MSGAPAVAIDLHTRTLAEALATGLSRPPPSAEAAARAEDGGILLRDAFRVMRGIATGENAFFVMTAAEVAARGLPPSAFVRCVGRTRDVEGPVLTPADLGRLDAAGRPTFLLALGPEPADALAPPLRAWLRRGEAAGLPNRPLIRQRRPWWRMEVRRPPGWLFAYLGRRSCRFVENRAGAVPLTGFLCVYRREEAAALPGWARPGAATAALNDPRTLAGLALVGKSYGGGAVKVEPRALDRLPIPAAVLRDHGLAAGAPAPGGQPALL